MTNIQKLIISHFHHLQTKNPLILLAGYCGFSKYTNKYEVIFLENCLLLQIDWWLP